MKDVLNQLVVIVEVEHINFGVMIEDILLKH